MRFHPRHVLSRPATRANSIVTLVMVAIYALVAVAVLSRAENPPRVGTSYLYAPAPVSTGAPYTMAP